MRSSKLMRYVNTSFIVRFRFVSLDAKKYSPILRLYCAFDGREESFSFPVSLFEPQPFVSEAFRMYHSIWTSLRNGRR